MRKNFLLRSGVFAVFATLLLACSPKYNWREVHGTAEPFTVIMPAATTTASRPINLNGIPVVMTMTAAEIGHNVFAVGAARVPKPDAAPAALVAMKTALVNNIHGRIVRETPAAAEANADPRSIRIEASGPPSPATGGQPRFLAARFVAQGDRVYQIVIMGTATTLPDDAVDLFLTSFKPE